MIVNEKNKRKLINQYRMSYITQGHSPEIAEEMARYDIIIHQKRHKQCLKGKKFFIYKNKRYEC